MEFRLLHAAGLLIFGLEALSIPGASLVPALLAALVCAVVVGLVAAFIGDRARESLLWILHWFWW